MAVTMTKEEVSVVGTNYFVSPLGQAALLNAQHPHQFTNINEFLDTQAQAVPDQPAVGFPIPVRGEDGGSGWSKKIISMYNHRPF